MTDETHVATKDRPILFSGPMVRALLAGMKSQTRRLATSPLRKCEPGDRLWVRETFSGPHWLAGLPPRDWPYTSPIWHWADGTPDDGDWTKPKPGMHMPRWACRLTLRVTEVRFQRLHDITEEDAEAEGVMRSMKVCDDDGCSFTDAYAELWVELQGQASWDANPDIVAIIFERGHD